MHVGQPVPRLTIFARTFKLSPAGDSRSYVLLQDRNNARGSACPQADNLRSDIQAVSGWGQPKLRALHP